MMGPVRQYVLLIRDWEGNFLTYAYVYAFFDSLYLYFFFLHLYLFLKEIKEIKKEEM